MGKKNLAYVNPKMLVWARKETPFAAPEDVESAFPKFSASKLASWEAGTDFPSINEAKRLASIYKLPFACFYLSEEPPKKPKRYTDRRTFKGLYSETPSYALWSEIKRLESVRDSILELTPDIEAVRGIPAVDENNIPMIAAAIREFLGLNTPLRTKSAYGSNPFNYYRDIIEHSNIIVVQISGVELEEMKGLSIFYDKYPIVAVNNKDFDRSKVFSLFHELAHIFRRSSSMCSIDEDYDDQEETICDRIAAEVLMPRTAFSQVAEACAARCPSGIDSICINRIAGRFGVSSISALRRLYEISFINRQTFFDLLEIITAEFEANRERIEQMRKGKNVPVYFHVKYINQNGSLLARKAFTALAMGQITHGEMCKMLSVNTKHIGSIEQAVMFR